MLLVAPDINSSKILDVLAVRTGHVQKDGQVPQYSWPRAAPREPPGPWDPYDSGARGDPRSGCLPQHPRCGVWGAARVGAAAGGRFPPATAGLCARGLQLSQGKVVARNGARRERCRSGVPASPATVPVHTQY